MTGVLAGLRVEAGSLAAGAFVLAAILALIVRPAALGAGAVAVAALAGAVMGATPLLMGFFAPAPGGLDGYGAFALAAVAPFAAAGVLAIGGTGVRAALCALAAAGATGAAQANDLVVALLALEAAFLAGVALLALGADQDRRALSAAFALFVGSTLAFAAAAVGLGLVIASTGAADDAGLAARAATSTAPAAGGFALLLAGLTGMALLTPWHGLSALAAGRSWRAGALLVAPTLAGAFVLLRVAGALGEGSSDLAAATRWALGAAAGVTILAASIQALAAQDLRRMAAFALAAQTGAALLAAAVAGRAGLAAGLVQLLAAHAGAAALFCLAAAARGQTPTAPLGAFDGFARSAPLTALAGAVGALSLIGAPFLAGFSGKWLAAGAALDAGQGWAAGLIAAMSLASAVAAGGVIERLYLRQPTPNTAAPNARGALWPGFALATAVTLGVGWQADWAMAGAMRAADAVYAAVTP
jgi:multicomponent Na+:H+ antiporter subunit D